MKRFLVAFLALVLTFICISSFALAADYSSMTEDELKREYDAIRNELTIKGLIAENKTAIIDNEVIKIYINGDIVVKYPYKGSDELCLYIPVVIVNNTKYNIGITCENSSINGWTAFCMFDTYHLPAGKKAMTDFKFYINNTDIAEASDFSDAEFCFEIYDNDTRDNIYNSEQITIYAK